MSGKLGDHIVTGLQRLSAGAVGAAVTAATLNPVAGVAAAAVMLTASDYAKAKVIGDGPDLATVEADVLLAYCKLLDERMGAIEEQLAASNETRDRQDLLTKELTYSRFIRSVSEAATPDKREAIVHATAHQFDPRKGVAATRDYWLQRVREIPDAELALVKLVVAHGEITFWNNAAYQTSGATTQAQPATQALSLPKADVVMHETLAQQVSARGPGQLVYSFGGRHVQTPTGSHALSAYALTVAGEIFISFCKDD